jgi:hypothetical protein
MVVNNPGSRSRRPQGSGFSPLFVGLAERAIDLAINRATIRVYRDKSIGEKFQMTPAKLAKMRKVEFMK